MQDDQVIPFKFEAQEVRTLLVDDQPWFVAGDVCEALAIVNTARALSRLDDDEKGVHTVNTLGGAQNVSTLNESGLYSLILTSRKAEAKRFKKWVTSEVLPTIRKTGRYEDANNALPTLLGQTIGTDGFHMLGALIKGKVTSLPSHYQRRAASKIWSQTHAAFGVRSAADIPATQLDAARIHIAAYVLEGELLPRESIEPDGVILSASDARHLGLLLTRFDLMRRDESDLLTAARALDSAVLLSLYSQLRESAGSLKSLRERLH